MIITTFYEGQEEEFLKVFLSKNPDTLVLSNVSIDGVNTIPFIKGSWHPQDDRFQVIKTYLEENKPKEDVTIVDWQFFVNSNINEIELKKLNKKENLLFNEGSIKAEDFKFPPAFESFLKIIDNIKILNSFYFFHHNPKILLPNLFSGDFNEILNLLDRVIKLRSKFVNPSIPLEVILFNYISYKC